jgi:hypothetical protein
MSWDGKVIICQEAWHLGTLSINSYRIDGTTTIYRFSFIIPDSFNYVHLACWIICVREHEKYKAFI